MWQPIETAPKDHWPIIIGYDGDWVALCCKKRYGSPDREIYVMCSGYGDGEPHVMYEGDYDGSPVWEFHPTHWMPFPDPPTLTK